jgi:hypothetical protein
MSDVYSLSGILSHFWTHHRSETNVFLFASRLLRWVFTHGGGLRSFISLNLYRKDRVPDHILTYHEFNRVNRNLMPNYYRCLLEDKLVFDRFMKSFGFPLAESFGLIHDNKVKWFSSGLEAPLEHLAEMELDCFMKMITQWGGEHVHRLLIHNGNITIDNQSAGIDMLKSMSCQGTFVLQKTIRQHAKMDQLNPSSVNSIRLVTISDGERIGNLAGFVRMGLRDSVIDNITRGGVGCGIHEDGTLHREGLNGSVRIDRHPTSGIVFEGFRLPWYREALNLVCHMHQAFHCFFIIAWDIAITEDGPVVIEGNPVGDLIYEQHFYTHIKEAFLSDARAYRKNRDAFVREFVLKDTDR